MATSEMALTEVLVRPLANRLDALVARYERFLEHSTDLRLVALDRKTARAAAQLRVDFGLRTPDAIHVASAMCIGATCFVTNDRALQRVNTLRVVLVADYASPPTP